MKTTAAAFLAIALAWAAPALAQESPPQERIHERLDVSFRDAAGEFLGRLFLSDVTTSHSAVDGYLQGRTATCSTANPRCSPNRTWCRSKPLREARSRTSPTSFPCCRVPKSEFQDGGPPGSLSLQCDFDGRRAEVIRRTQRSINDEPPGSVSQTERVASTLCVVTVNGVEYPADGTLSWMRETRTGALIMPPQFPG